MPLSLWVLLALVLYAASPASSRAAKLRKVPGAWLYSVTRYRLAWDAWKARSVHAVNKLHREYGPVVRIGPSEVSFNSLSSLRTIYGAGSGFERTSFYRMFDAY